MSGRYADVVDGKVVGVFLWDGEDACPVDPSRAVLLEGEAGIGWDYQDGQFVDLRPSSAMTWYKIRTDRDLFLQQSDWTQMPDVPLDTGTKAAWSDYRQALRDLPSSFASPDDVVWPVAPDYQPEPDYEVE